MIASDVLNPARILLKDSGSLGAFRWNDSTLLLWLHHGAKAIIDALPTAFATNDFAYPLVEGFRQTAPEDTVQIIDVFSNDSGSIATKIDRQTLSLEDPNWRNEAAATDVLHWITDPGDPTRFEVYPPQPSSAGSIDIRYSTYPAPFAATTDEIGLHEKFKVSLQHFVCFSALNENSNNAMNKERANEYLEMFKADVQSLIMSEDV